MKSIKYYLMGLFILSLVLVSSNSFSQVSSWWAEMQGKDIMEHLRKFGVPGAGGPITGYSQPSASGEDTFVASTMIWSQLKTPQGDYLAEIKDLVIDPVSGRVSNVVLTRIRGMGAEDVAVPFSTVSKIGQNIFIHRAPEDVYQFYGQTPYWSEGLYICSKVQPPTGSYRTSKLIGSVARTPKGQDLGRTDDLVISTDGLVVSLVVSDNGKMVTVPFSDVEKP